MEPIAWTTLDDAPMRQLSPAVRVRPLRRGAHDREYPAGIFVPNPTGSSHVPSPEPAAGCSSPTEG